MIKTGIVIIRQREYACPMMFKVVEDTDDDTNVKVVQINSTLDSASKYCEPGWVTLMPALELELSSPYFIGATKPDYKVWNGVHIFYRCLNVPEVEGRATHEL